MKTKKKSAAPRRVDVINNADDKHCVQLAQVGVSNKVIKEITGLSDGQIAYRLKLKDIKRADYRNGESPIAKLFINAAIQNRDLNANKMRLLLAAGLRK